MWLIHLGVIVALVGLLQVCKEGLELEHEVLVPVAGLLGVRVDEGQDALAEALDHEELLQGAVHVADAPQVLEARVPATPIRKKYEHINAARDERIFAGT